MEDYNKTRVNAINSIIQILKGKVSKSYDTEKKNNTIFDKLLVDENKIFPVVVASNISSGKSTLINALLGKELLPSKNQVCTAKSVGILDNDKLDSFRIHMVDKEDNYEIVSRETCEKVRDYNDNNDIKEMIIEGNIKGVVNCQKALFIIDTPGMNNALDNSHQEITISTLQKISEGLLLYVFDAGHLSTYDDENSLKLISMALEKKRVKVIFIVNRMDIVDSEKENQTDMLLKLRTYLQSLGFNKPIIVPISAMCALLIKKVLNRETLTENDEDNFFFLYKKFKGQNNSLSNFFIGEDFEEMTIEYIVDGVKFKKKDLQNVLENSGFVKLESLVNDLIVRSSDDLNLCVNFKK